MKILSIDGGGVRVARAAKYIVDTPSILSTFDCFAGCSAGSILAASYALGLSAEYVQHAFLEFCPSIFKQNFFEKLQDLFIFKPKYSSKNLKKAIQYIFKNTKMEDLKNIL